MSRTSPLPTGTPITITGGLGFIGSAYARHRASKGSNISNLDAFTYAADRKRVEGHDRVTTLRTDIVTDDLVSTLGDLKPRMIIHFAAESHVTRSESDPELFYATNVEGTRRLLEASCEIRPELVIHVSTDEVYGPCPGEPFREEEKLPGEGGATSAYARSKALADDLAASFAERLPMIVVRMTNCFGPWQHPEKAIPRWIARGLSGESLPVWGDGRYVRDWLYADDACSGIDLLVERGVPGEIYNLGPSGEQRTNLEIARLIARFCGRGDDAVYLTEYDRPAHDRRYAVDASKIRRLGWAPSDDLETRLRETVDWYANNHEWWRSVRTDAERLYDDAKAAGG